MEDVLLGREAASERDSSQGSDFWKSIRVGPKTLKCHHPKERTQTALACVPLCLPVTGQIPGGCAQGIMKGLGQC